MVKSDLVPHKNVRTAPSAPSATVSPPPTQDEFLAWQKQQQEFAQFQQYQAMQNSASVSQQQQYAQFLQYQAWQQQQQQTTTAAAPPPVAVPTAVPIAQPVPYAPSVQSHWSQISRAAKQVKNIVNGCRG